MANAELDSSGKMTEMQKFYWDVIYEQFKSSHKTMISLKLAKELNDSKALLYEAQSVKAKLILEKYQILTREY